MSSVSRDALRPVRLLLLLLATAFLSACQVELGGSGPLVNTRAPVAVALLVPFGSQDTNNDTLATSLQNAAQLAVSDLGDVKIDLRIYNTSGTPAGAAAAATKAVNEGAKIILGPVFGDSANAAGAAVASRGISVLSFSNNTEIAGGNIFVLGHTFANTANRLISYAASTGLDNVLVVHANNLTGQIGLKAVQQAAATSGVNFTGSASYEFSQGGVIGAVQDIAQQVKDTGTNMIVFASDTGGALPILAQLLPENGVDPKVIKFMGLTRWDIPTQTLSLTGLQGGWFALPDPSLTGSFRDRYIQAYGQKPHPLAGIAYDGVAAVGALIAKGKSDALSRTNLTQKSGFAGVNGIFRLMPDGTNERAMAVVQIENKQVKVIDPAPRSFGAVGF
ncbi:MAG: penicillin-binding protein activator [Alphaproteobacteria bacterium]|nr:penicillin-binding protein activator [Alphaproteobacteria bacterium]